MDHAAWQPGGGDASGLPPALRAFEQWLRQQDGSLEVRGPADGWRAVYVERRLALMVRARTSRTVTQLDVVSRRTGLDLRLTSTTQLSESAFADSIREALAAARDSRPPVRGIDDTGDEQLLRGRLGLFFLLVSSTIRFLLVAPAWLRGTAWAAIALSVAAIAYGMLTGAPTLLAALVVLVGTLVAALVLRLRFPPTALDSAEVEEGMRAHVGLLGCLGTGVLLLGGLMSAMILATVLADAGMSFGDLFGPLYLLAVGLAWVVALLGIRRLQRRKPSPPSSRAAGVFGRVLVLVAVVLTLGYGVFLALGTQMTSVTAEQAAWCLGPGRPYVDRAVEVIGIPRTWAADASAAQDRNFASACHLAWEATDP